jgi:hypothetical protein
MTIDLPAGHRAIPLDDPLELIDCGSAGLRAELLRVSNAAFGRDTSELWTSKFCEEFLGSLTGFYLIHDSARNLMGWSGYRTKALGDQAVYFTSTGLLPCAQGRGLVAAFQRKIISAVAKSHPSAWVSTAVRTRNPHSYRLALKVFGPEIFPGVDGRVPAHHHGLVTAIARWLGLGAFDPSTGRVTGAYRDDLYGVQPRTGNPIIDHLFDTLGPYDAFLICGRQPPKGLSAQVAGPSVGEELGVPEPRPAILLWSPP